MGTALGPRPALEKSTGREAAARPRVGATDHLVGPVLALRPLGEQWAIVRATFSIVSPADPHGIL